VKYLAFLGLKEERFSCEVEILACQNGKSGRLVGTKEEAEY
jgi:hypothetical protein